MKYLKKVWKDCDHDWERCSDYDDLCRFICRKCTLYNNPYFYTYKPNNTNLNNNTKLYYL